MGVGQVHVRWGKLARRVVPSPMSPRLSTLGFGVFQAGRPGLRDLPLGEKRVVEE